MHKKILTIAAVAILFFSLVYIVINKSKSPDKSNDPSKLEKAKIESGDAIRISDARQIDTALEFYYSDKKDFPDTLDPLVESYGITRTKDPSGVNYSYTKLKDDYKICFVLELGTKNFPQGNNCFDKNSF